MRIGVNCCPLRPDTGGMRTYVAEVLAWLLVNDPQNSYRIFCTRESFAELRDIPSVSLKGSATIVDDETAILQSIPDLDVYFCPLGVLSPRPVWKPSVVTLPDVQEVFHPEFFSPEARYSRAIEHPAAIHAADCVITISAYSRQSMIDKYGAHPDRVSVAPLFAADVFRSDGDTLAASQVWPPFSQYLLYPANRWPHKNHDVLLRALAALAQDGRRFSLVTTGRDVPDGYPLLAKAAEYGVSSQIWDAEYVSAQDLARLYSKAHALVFPSLFEGFGMPALEAMAACCPVLAAHATALPEVCGDAAVYFDPASPSSVARAITSLDDPALRDALVRRGRDRSAEYSVARTANIHLQVFRAAAASYSRTRTAWQAYACEPMRRAAVIAKRLTSLNGIASY